jgi:predicted LPLAT superfamily acyltransferase
MDFQPRNCYIQRMSRQIQSATAARIRELARQYHAYIRTKRDRLAHHIARLAGDDVELDEIEQLLIALQRAGYLSRIDTVRLQGNYLRESNAISS